MSKRRGRGRLSKIDMLPAEADEAVQWAAFELREQNLTQIQICSEFNEKLAMLGIDPVSSSAFNRYSIRLADMLRRSSQTREIAAVLTDRMEPGQSDDITITLAEMIKTLISELLDKGGEAGFSPKQAMELAGALKSAVAAEKMSSDRRAKLEAMIEGKVDEVIDKVSVEAGLSKQRIEQLKTEFLGVKPRDK